jgi:glycerol dehydrogenase-like iron-containing ADH family enzyme
MGIVIGGIGAIWYGVAAAVAVGTSVGTTAYSSSQEASQQKKLLEAQEGQVAAAEAKVAEADKLAADTAAEKLRKQRLAQTNTILTSPLGVSGEANVGMSKLLGG